MRRKIVGVQWNMVKVHISLAPEIHENQSYAPYIRYNVRPSGCLGNQRPTGCCPPISSSSCEAFAVYVALCGGLRSEPNATGEFGHLEYGKYISQSALRWRWYERREGDLVLSSQQTHSVQVPLRPTAAPARRPGTRAAKPLAPGARQANHDMFKRLKLLPSEVSTAPPRDGAPPTTPYTCRLLAAMCTPSLSGPMYQACTANLFTGME